MQLLNWWRELQRRHSRYQPLVTVNVYKSALLQNLAHFQKFRPALAVAPVLKSNAYGHGLIPVAKVFDLPTVPFLAVDSPYEAIVLRHAGVSKPLVVLGYTLPANIARLRLHQVSFAITDLTQLKSLAGIIRRPTVIHLKIDTGMHRQGLEISQLPEAIAIIKRQPRLVLEGAFSHFADPVNHEEFTATVQIARWHEALKIISKNFGALRYKHIAATSGYATTSAIDANVARVGLGLYGIAPFLPLPLTPALELTTIITAVKAVPPGEGVGYNLTWQAPAESRVAVLPLGYFEGIDLRLSNQGVVKIRDEFCPIIGRVSMNITTVDVSALANPQVGERVVVISRDPQDPNSAQRLAEQCQTIPYEILVHIPAQLRRVII